MQFLTFFINDRKCVFCDCILCSKITCDTDLFPADSCLFRGVDYVLTTVKIVKILH